MSRHGRISVLEGQAPAARRADATPETPVRIGRTERRTTTKPSSARPGRLRGLVIDVLWLAAIGLLVFATWPLSLGGSTSYVIVHGLSMDPTYKSGDLVVTRTESSYHIGDIIAYKIPKPSPIAGHMVIHRVKEITPKGILTKGDNRETEDQWYLHHDDIVGKAVLHIPMPGGERFWGYVPWAFCALIGVAVIWVLWPPRPSAAELDLDREQRAEDAREARHELSRRERRERRAARAEIAQMVTGAVALVGAGVILVVTMF
jgi:signal peptidase